MSGLSKILQDFEKTKSVPDFKDCCGNDGEQDSNTHDISDKKLEAQDKVTNFLLFLAESNKSKEEIESRVDDELVPVYQIENFRHSYFKISALLQELKKTSSKADSIDVLKENLSILENEIIINKKYEALIKCFDKLCDHCNLEISRFSYFDRVFWRNDSAKNELEKISLDYKQSKEEFEKAEKDFEEVRAYMSNAKAEYVTILSILAAIMLAGMGGFTVLGNIAANVRDVSTYRFFIVTSFLGLILFNVVFMLIYMIARLTGKNIYTICTDTKKDIGADCVKDSCSNSCCGLDRVRKRLPYIFWTNIVLIIIILVSLWNE